MRNDQEISVGVCRSGCTPPGTSFAPVGTGAVGDDRQLRDGTIRKAVGGIERRVLIGAVAERVLQIVVHSEAGANHGAVRRMLRTGSRRIPTRGCGRNFALFAVNARAADGGLGRDDAAGEGVVARRGRALHSIRW